MPENADPMSALVDDAVSALHVRCQPVAPCSLPVGFATDYERALRMLLRASLAPETDRDAEIDPAWCDCGDEPRRGISVGRHMTTCRYGIIEDYLGSLPAPAPSLEGARVYEPNDTLVGLASRMGDHLIHPENHPAIREQEPTDNCWIDLYRAIVGLDPVLEGAPPKAGEHDPHCRSFMPTDGSCNCRAHQAGEPTSVLHEDGSEHERWEPCTLPSGHRHRCRLAPSPGARYDVPGYSETGDTIAHILDCRGGDDCRCGA